MTPVYLDTQIDAPGPAASFVRCIVCENTLDGALGARLRDRLLGDRWNPGSDWSADRHEPDLGEVLRQSHSGPSSASGSEYSSSARDPVKPGALEGPPSSARSPPCSGLGGWDRRWRELTALAEGLGRFRCQRLPKPASRLPGQASRNVRKARVGGRRGASLRRRHVRRRLYDRWHQLLSRSRGHAARDEARGTARCDRPGG